MMMKWMAALALIVAVLGGTANGWAQGYYGPPPQQYPGYYPQQNPGYPQYPQYPGYPQQTPRPRKPKPKRSPNPDAAETPPPAPVDPPSIERVPFVWANSDSLEKVAASCNTTVAAILGENNLRRSELREGQVLQLPAPPAERRLAAFAPERQAAREVWRGIRGGKRIALTFDAGSMPDGGSEILAALEQAEAPATFFVTGQFTTKYPDLVKQMADGGHPVLNHSWSHPEFTKSTDDVIRQELQRTDWAVRDLTGTATKPYWRPPFGDRDDRVLRLAAAEGYQSIYWTLDSLDSVGEKKPREFILNRILNPPKSGDNPDHFLDGAIVLMHVGMPETARAVPELIDALRHRGFRLVTVAEILQPTSQPQ